MAGSGPVARECATDLTRTYYADLEGRGSLLWRRRIALISGLGNNTVSAASQLNFIRPAPFPWTVFDRVAMLDFSLFAVGPGRLDAMAVSEASEPRSRDSASRQILLW